MDRRVDPGMERSQMKRTYATRLYTFQELMNRLDSDYWYVHHHGMGYYTFVPVQQPGRA